MTVGHSIFCTGRFHRQLIAFDGVFWLRLTKTINQAEPNIVLKCYRVWWAPALRFSVRPFRDMFPTARLSPVQTTFNHYIAPNLLQHLKWAEITFYSNIVWVTALCIIPPETMAKFCFSTDLLNNLIKWGHHFSISGGGGWGAQENGEHFHIKRWV